jgi:hypothetical protein
MGCKEKYFFRKPFFGLFRLKRIRHVLLAEKLNRTPTTEQNTL